MGKMQVTILTDWLYKETIDTQGRSDYDNEAGTSWTFAIPDGLEVEPTLRATEADGSRVARHDDDLRAVGQHSGAGPGRPALRAPSLSVRG